MVAELRSSDARECRRRCRSVAVEKNQLYLVTVRNFQSHGETLHNLNRRIWRRRTRWKLRCRFSNKISVSHWLDGRIDGVNVTDDKLKQFSLLWLAPINHLWVYANIFWQKDFLTRLNHPRILWLKRHSFQSLRPRCHHPLLLLDYPLLWLDFENQKLTWISIKSADFLFPWRLCCCLPQKWSH